MEARHPAVQQVAILRKKMIFVGKQKKNKFSANENFDATYPTKIVVSHNGELQQVPPGLQHIKRFK